jgi:glutamate-1-semialdehyde 2,1-aminomutase
MLEQGVYFAPASYEAGFVSACHCDNLIDQTIAAAAKAFAQL